MEAEIEEKKVGDIGRVFKKAEDAKAGQGLVSGSGGYEDRS
jgi:hypothetical protein